MVRYSPRAAQCGQDREELFLPDQQILQVRPLRFHKKGLDIMVILILMLMP